MARRVDRLSIEFADLEAFTVSEQVIEIAAIGFQVGGVEDRSENSLHVLDVLADADFRAGLGLDVRRAGEMVGMGVGLERPHDGVALLFRHTQDGVDRADVDRAETGVVVEHGVDHRRLLGSGVGYDIAHGIGGLVKKRANDGLTHGHEPPLLDLDLCIR